MILKRLIAPGSESYVMRDPMIRYWRSLASIWNNLVSIEFWAWLSSSSRIQEIDIRESYLLACKGRMTARSRLFLWWERHNGHTYQIHHFLANRAQREIFHFTNVWGTCDRDDDNEGEVGTTNYFCSLHRHSYFKTWPYTIFPLIDSVYIGRDTGNR